jgi:PAS domain S-box-containing protein
MKEQSTEPTNMAMRNYKLYNEHFRPGFLAEQDILFRVIFEESPDAIFFLNTANFSIIDCNSKAQQLFQVEDKVELIGRESFALYDSEPVEFSKNTFIDTINSGLEHSQEMAFRSIKGNVFWGKCSLRKVDTAKGPVIVFRVRRVVDYMKTAEMLSIMVKQTARVTGMEYFTVLTELLVKTFGVSLAMIARVDDEVIKANVIQSFHKQQVAGYSAFDLATSPSLNVLRGYTAYYPSNLKEMFPDDRLIARLDMESYMGTPVFNGQGEVCALLIMMDDKPMEEIPNSRNMLSLFASRVGTELERMQEEESYKRKIAELQQALIKQAQPVVNQ